MLLCRHVLESHCDRKEARKDYKLRWGYFWISVGNPMSSKFDPKSNEVAQLAFISSFTCKAHQGNGTISWLFLVTCCDFC
jgi:hypothetical protein